MAEAAEQQADVDELQQQIATILASEAALSKNHVEIQQEMEALRQEKAALLEGRVLWAHTLARLLFISKFSHHTL